MRARLFPVMLIVAMAAVAAAPLDVLAQQTQAKPEPFVPRSGQPGKDVVWVPSPQQTVERMMEIARVTSSDYVIDLGSGDGRNVIAAARRGANALGVEYNPEMVALSERLAKEAGVAEKARFVQGDMYEADISKATVMALFLLPVNLNKLAPKFLDLAPGSRIVGNTFGIDGWEPDLREAMPPGSDCDTWCDILLWIVPAKVAGTWKLSNGGLLELTQEYQRVQGTATINGQKLTVSNGRLNGAELSFVAGERTFTGRVNGNRIEGGSIGTASLVQQ